MNDVPLIQRADVNSINTSIIAIKKQLKQIEQMLGGIGGTELPTDILYRRDIADVVQEGNNNPVSSGAVDEAIKSLDVASVGGSGKYISAIEEVDGKINATATNLATIVQSGNDNPATSNAVASALNDYIKKYQITISGYISYILIADITKWYNSTSITIQQSVGFCGLLCTIRTSGNISNGVDVIGLSVSYYRNGANINDMSTSSLFHTNLGGNNIYRACVIQYNNRIYLAIKHTDAKATTMLFVGNAFGNILLTQIPNSATVTEIWVSST